MIVGGHERNEGVPVAARMKTHGLEPKSSTPSAKRKE